jgi:hypothetical protein
MPIDESLVARVRAALGRRKGITEKKMFGGRAFLLNGNLLVGVKDSLLVRIDPDDHDEVLAEPHVTEFVMAGRPPMRGWVRVLPPGLAEDAALKSWLRKGTTFVAKLPPK